MSDGWGDECSVPGKDATDRPMHVAAQDCEDVAAPLQQRSKLASAFPKPDGIHRGNSGLEWQVVHEEECGIPSAIVEHALQPCHLRRPNRAVAVPFDQSV